MIETSSELINELIEVVGEQFGMIQNDIFVNFECDILCDFFFELTY